MNAPRWVAPHAAAGVLSGRSQRKRPRRRPAATQPAGSPVAFGAGSSRCPYPRYAYYMLLNGRRTLKRGFSSSGSPTWSTPGMAPGTYYVRVWANQAGDQTARPETLAQSKITLTGVHEGGGESIERLDRGGIDRDVHRRLGDLRKSPVRVLAPRPEGSVASRANLGRGELDLEYDRVGKGGCTLSVWANQQGSYLGRQQVYAVANYTLV